MISIISPVYNVEKYLARCIESVLAQTNGDFELILVDDGATDLSGKICDEYAIKDNRIKVLHCENGGLAQARNRGLEIASGEYITFLDSDDWINKEYVETVTNLIKGDSELYVFSFVTDFQYLNTSELMQLEDLSNVPVIDAILYLDRNHCFNLAWNKVFKKSVINDFPISRFTPHSEPGEDLIFVSNYLQKVKTVGLSSKVLLHYMRQGENTLANKYYPDLFEKNKKFIFAKKSIYDFYKMDSAESKKGYSEIFIHYIFTCIPNMYRKNSTATKEERLAFYNEILSWDECKKQVEIYSENDKLKKKFIKLYKKGKAKRLDRYYKFVCWCRNKFEKPYRLFRKIFILGE